MRLTLIAGGVGGAKMAEGFAGLADVSLDIIGNIADDEEFHGLWVSPDIDTMVYTLAGVINRHQGWGLEDEGRRALDMLARLGEESWMFLGDRDFGLHIHRTARIAKGERRSIIAADIARAFGVTANIILPTDDVVQTRLRTSHGWLSFQEYFVREKCEPEVLQIKFEGIDSASPTDEALAAIGQADLIVVAPSNPLVSVAPILGISGLRAAIAESPVPCIAVSPLIQGQVIKGPADRMLASLGHKQDAAGVAALYADFADLMLIDSADAGIEAEISRLGMKVAMTDILMRDTADKIRLAGEIMVIGEKMAMQEMPNEA